MAVCVYMEINLLFLSQVLYNKAYSELQLGRRQQCDELLENGREIASGVSESRHRIITSAIESLKVTVYILRHTCTVHMEEGLFWVYIQ
jgi:hypothetical protein